MRYGLKEIDMMTVREVQFLLLGLRLGYGEYSSLHEYDSHRKRFSSDTRPLHEDIEESILGVNQRDLANAIEALGLDVKDVIGNACDCPGDDAPDPDCPKCKGTGREYVASK